MRKVRVTRVFLHTLPGVVLLSILAGQVSSPLKVSARLEPSQVKAEEVRPEKTQIVTLRTYFPINRVQQGSKVRVAVKPQIAERWHINSFQPIEEFLIPTKLTFTPIEGIAFSTVDYPLHELLTFPFSEEQMAVYTGTVIMFATMTVSENLPTGNYTLKTDLFYQACDDRQCLAPAFISAEIPFEVVAKGTPVVKINEEIFGSATIRTTTEISMEGGVGNEITRLLEEKGWFLTFFFIFLGGLALNLTPCVYPLIPITIGFFVNQAEGKLRRSFFLAILYVIGMSITYSLLGLMASISGGMLGSVLQKPAALIFIALVLVALSSSMFGAFEIRIPQKLALIGGTSRQGNIGSILMGLTVGIIAAPCIGPFILSLLLYVAEKGDPLTGFLMFFVLSLGLGLPFIFLGAFSGSVTKLPQSGVWMVWVRKVFGFVLIGLAIYFLKPLLSESLFWGGLIATTFTAGIYLGWIDKSTSRGKVFTWVKKGIASLALLLGIYFILPEKEVPTVQWQPYNEGLLDESLEKRQAVMIDFYADWCIPCKELDKFTFTDTRVIDLSKQLLPLKADLTQEGSVEVQDLRKKYRIVGVPTIVFIDAAGKEREDLRLTGFLNAKAFGDLMNNVLTGSDLSSREE